MNALPTISIAMATYNGDKYLREQLDSIAAQTLPPCEIQIGDDGSTDRTEDIVRDFAASAAFPVIFHRNERNLGYGENFLQTAARCSGEWIAFCDQDDIWCHEKLEAVHRAIQQGGKRLMLVAHNAVFQDDAGERIDVPSISAFGDHIFPSRSLPATWLCAGFRQVFRRSLLTNFDSKQRVGAIFRSDDDHGFDPLPHDSWIPFLANMTGNISTLSDALVTYRRHSSNATAIAHPVVSAKGALSNNASTYDYEAEWYRRAAESLGKAVVGQHSDVVGEAQQRLVRERQWLLQRSELYRAGNLSKRIKIFSALVRSGAYRRSWSLSARSLLKDGIFSFLPAARNA